MKDLVSFFQHHQSVVGSNKTLFFTSTFYILVCNLFLCNTSTKDEYLTSGFADLIRCALWNVTKEKENTSSFCVSLMCELDVGMSLVKVMTNRQGRVEHRVGVGGTEQCSMGCKYAEHARWLYRSLLVMSSFSSHTEGNPQPGPTLQRVCVCVCVCVRCGCVWLSELLDFQHVELQVWKLGVRFMCDKLPTCGLIGATPPFFSFPFSSFQRGENAPFPQLDWILGSVNI